MKKIIFNKAKELMHREGCRFYLDTLAKELRMSKKSIYKYYENKESIIRDVINETLIDTKEAQNEINNSELDLVTKIKALLQVAPINSELFNSKTLQELRQLYPSLYNEINTLFQSDWENTFMLMDEAVEKNLLKSYNKELFKHLYISGIFYEYDESLSYQDRLQNTINLLFGGIE